MGHLFADHGQGGSRAASPASLRPRPSVQRTSVAQRTPVALLALQRSAGNAATSQVIVQRQPGGGAHLTSSTRDETLTAFATSSAELTAAHQEALTRIAAELNAQPLVLGGFVTLVGSADRRGKAGENQALGQRRADAARVYLQALVTDESTAQQIRAYSLGAPTEGPVGDVPSLRKVEITITRRSYDLGLPDGVLSEPSTSGPSPAAKPSSFGGPSRSVPDLLRLPPSVVATADQRQSHLPDWFWRQLPARPPEPSAISQVSRFLNETLRTRDLARVGGAVAGAFGFNRAQVQRLLDDAFQDGGESAVKELLNTMIRGVAGSPSGRPSSPYGPPVEPIPFPSPQLQLPPIRF